MQKQLWILMLINRIVLVPSELNYEKIMPKEVLFVRHLEWLEFFSLRRKTFWHVWGMLSRILVTTKNWRIKDDVIHALTNNQIRQILDIYQIMHLYELLKITIELNYSRKWKTDFNGVVIIYNVVLKYCKSILNLINYD